MDTTGHQETEGNYIEAMTLKHMELVIHKVYLAVSAAADDPAEAASATVPVSAA
jgi:hypothetical protein